VIPFPHHCDSIHPYIIVIPFPHHCDSIHPYIIVIPFPHHCDSIHPYIIVLTAIVPTTIDPNMFLRSAASGLQSYDEYLFGIFNMRIKLQAGDSAGVVTSYYVSCAYYSTESVSLG
jgi:hypothetical protein